MTRIIAVANQKGGVGKTTTSINLAACVALADHSVLLIDLDPQANATSGVGVDARQGKQSVYDSLMRGIPLHDVIVETTVPKLSLAPSHADLVGAEVELVSVPERELVLKRALDPVAASFEYVVIDCPPALGFLTINAFVTASSILVPVQCEYYAMEGLGRLMENVHRIQNGLNPRLQVEGIVLTMFDSRNSLARQVADEIRNHFKEKVYKTVIPRNVTLAEAPSYGRPVALYNAASSGAQAYVELAKEVVHSGKESTG